MVERLTVAVDRLYERGKHENGVTKTGKLVARKSGQDHFNAKERGRTKGAKKRGVSLALTTRVKRQFLGGQ